MKNFLLFFSLILCSVAFAQCKEDSLTLHTSSGDLYGSLIVPANTNSFDVVIIQPGSGPTDRNGNNPMGVKANSYRMLADSLARYDIATLLIDKRGIAASAKSFTDESKIVFEDYIKDLEEWSQLLRKDSRVKQIVLAGHSEGSLIAMVAAQRVKADKYISIAGPSKPIDEILSWQLKQQVPALASAADSILPQLKNGQTVANISPELNILFRPSVQPYLISWMKYNPCEEIGKLTIPVLIIQGTTDLQVQQSEGEALHTCNKQSSLSMIEEMNHVLKKATGNRIAQAASYSSPDLPIPQQLVADIVTFIKK